MNVKKAKADNRPVMARMFSGINELVTWLETTPVDEGWNKNHIGEGELNFKFCGAHSYEEARADMLKGKNIAQIKKAIPKGNKTRETKKRGLDVIGGCPNIPAYLAGNPANMYRVKATKTRGAYNIFVDVAVSAYVGKAQIRDAGIQILVKVLQVAQKYPVNLYVGDIGLYDKKALCNAVKIMDAGRAFNVARVSYALTEPAFLRVFGLGCIERNGGFWDSRAQYAYGSPVHYKKERDNIIKEFMQNAITVSMTDVINNSRIAFDDINAIL